MSDAGLPRQGRPLPDRELLSRKITEFAQAYHGVMLNQMHPDHRRAAWMEVHGLLDDIYGGSDTPDERPASTEGRDNERE